MLSPDKSIQIRRFHTRTRSCGINIPFLKKGKYPDCTHHEPLEAAQSQEKIPLPPHQEIVSAVDQSRGTPFNLQGGGKKTTGGKLSKPQREPQSWRPLPRLIVQHNLPIMKETYRISVSTPAGTQGGIPIMESCCPEIHQKIQANKIQAIIMSLHSLISTDTDLTKPEPPQAQAQQYSMKKKEERQLTPPTPRNDAI